MKNFDQFVNENNHLYKTVIYNADNNMFNDDKLNDADETVQIYRLLRKYDYILFKKNGEKDFRAPAKQIATYVLSRGAVYYNYDNMKKIYGESNIDRKLNFPEGLSPL